MIISINYYEKSYHYHTYKFTKNVIKTAEPLKLKKLRVIYSLCTHLTGINLSSCLVNVNQIIKAFIKIKYRLNSSSCFPIMVFIFILSKLV